MEDTETLPPTRSLSRQFPAQTTDKKRKRGSREDDGQQEEERELSRTSKGEISSLRPQSPAKEFTSAVSKKVAVFKGKLYIVLFLGCLPYSSLFHSLCRAGTKNS